MNKKICIIVFVAIVAVAIVCNYILLGPRANAGSKKITITIEHSDGASVNVKMKTNAEYLRQALDERNLVSGRDGEFGLWIDSIDGETADASKDQWWGYTVNGEFAVYGVDDQVITDGDVYVFTLNTGY